MRKQKNPQMKRLVAALTSAAILIGATPATSQPITTTDTDSSVSEALTAVSTAAEPQPDWTVEDALGNLTSEPPVASVAEKPVPAEVSEPTLEEDVAFTHVGTTKDGKEEYELKAKVLLPANGDEAQPYRADDITLMRTEGDIDLESVDRPEIDGTPRDDSTVTLTDVPDKEQLADAGASLVASTEEATGDLVTFDTSDVELERSTTLTARVVTDSVSPTPVRFQLFNAAALADNAVGEGATLPIDPSSPVPADHARIVVQVAGDWNGGRSNPAVPLPDGRLPEVRAYTPGTGATLRLYEPKKTADGSFGPGEANKDLQVGSTNPQENTELTPVGADWAVCTADAAGQCVFDVPIGVHNYFWVGMEKASPGFTVIDQIRVGGSGNTREVGDVLRYAYATPGLKAGMTYYSGVNYYDRPLDRWGNGAQGKQVSHQNAFMTSLSESEFAQQSRARNSRGSMFQVRDNPPLRPGCGDKKIGFLIDTSGSMGSQGIQSVKDVMTGILGGLANTPTEVGMATFATASPGYKNAANILAPQDLSKGVPPKLWTYVNALTQNSSDAVRDGDTDWEEGLRQFYNQDYDLVFMITDGNPTRSYASVNGDDGSGVHTSFQLVEAAVGVSNALKAQGTRVVPIGIPAKWTHNPVTLDAFMYVLLGGVLWDVIKAETNMKVEKPTASQDAQLDLSKHNLAALSGPVQGTDPRVADFMLEPTSTEIVKGVLDAALGCSITVERRFYEGKDPVADPPTLANSRPTVEESAQWPFVFEAQPDKADGEGKVAVLPTRGQNRSYPGADPNNLAAEYVLSGRNRYSYIDVTEQKSPGSVRVGDRNVDVTGVPEGWVPVNVATGKNATGTCAADEEGTEDQDANIEDLGSAKTSPKTNDFRANNIPVEGGCHYIVYYMKEEEVFRFILNKVDANNQDQGLDGAEFKLEGLDEANAGDKLADTVEGAGTGEFNWTKLEYGRYKLTETKAADNGYVMLADPVYFRVASASDDQGAAAGKVTKLYILRDAEDTAGSEVTDPDSILTFPVVEFAQTSSEDEAQVRMKLANTKLGELPKTGGPGLAGPLLCGLFMMLAGAVVARRRYLEA